MIHRKILTTALAALALAFAAPALGATARDGHHHKAPHRYSPRHGARCRKGYRRVARHRHGRRRRRVYCVRRARRKKAPTATPAPAAPAPKVRLHAHLDPTFTRDPSDPFKVTYAFSASATQQAFSAQGASLGPEESAALPSGVLALYSDGRLECAINVGDSATGSECPVDYSTRGLGDHPVTTIYTSGEQSATETEVEHIAPFAITLEPTVSYTPEELSFGAAGFGWRQIGTIQIAVDISPLGLSASSITDRQGDSWRSVTAALPVEARADSTCDASPGETIPMSGDTSIRSRQDLGIGTGWLREGTAAEFEAGAVTFWAKDEYEQHTMPPVFPPPGYEKVEEELPLRFTPTVIIADEWGPC